MLCLRETPISLIHARAMVQVIEAGAFVMPASPSFYSRPKDIGELVDTVVSRLLDRLGIPNDLMRRWEGLARSPSVHRRPGAAGGLNPCSPPWHTARSSAPGSATSATRCSRGERLDEVDALRLFETTDLAAVGALANDVRERAARRPHLLQPQPRTSTPPTSAWRPACSARSRGPKTGPPARGTR